MGFFKVNDRKDPDKERRLATLYLIKHKKSPEVKNEEAFKEEPVHPVLKHTKDQ